MPGPANDGGHRHTDTNPVAHTVVALERFERGARGMPVQSSGSAGGIGLPFATSAGVCPRPGRPVPRRPTAGRHLALVPAGPLPFLATTATLPGPHETAARARSKYRALTGAGD